MLWYRSLAFRLALALIFILFHNLGLTKDLEEQSLLDSSHERISNRIFRITNRLDSFFGNKKSLDENNGSNIRVYYLTTQNEYESVKNEPNVSMNIKLKELEKKLSFKFEKQSKARDVEDKTANGTIERKEGSSTDKEGYSTSLSLSNTDQKFWHLSSELGAKLDVPINPFLSVRARRSIITSKWEIRFIEQLIHYSQGGLFQFTNVDFYRNISTTVDFRYTNYFSWENEKSKTLTTHGPSIYKKINERLGMSYNIRSYTSTQPVSELAAHSIYTTFRYLLYDKWFFTEFVPGLAFTKDNDFRRAGYFSIKFEAIFGNF